MPLRYIYIGEGGGGGGGGGLEVMLILDIDNMKLCQGPAGCIEKRRQGKLIF